MLAENQSSYLGGGWALRFAQVKEGARRAEGHGAKRIARLHLSQRYARNTEKRRMSPTRDKCHFQVTNSQYNVQKRTIVLFSFLMKDSV